MTREEEFHEQAVRDVAEAARMSAHDLAQMIRDTPKSFYAYAVSQRERVLQLEAAIRWALGYGDFRERRLGEGAYWWRHELAERAALAEPEREKGNLCARCGTAVKGQPLCASCQAVHHPEARHD